MNDMTQGLQWQQYLETPIHPVGPSRVPAEDESLLLQRMARFTNSRRVKPYSIKYLQLLV